jgi:hypothetical protein
VLAVSLYTVGSIGLVPSWVDIAIKRRQCSHAWKQVHQYMGSRVVLGDGQAVAMTCGLMQCFRKARPAAGAGAALILLPLRLPSHGPAPSAAGAHPQHTHARDMSERAAGRAEGIPRTRVCFHHKKLGPPVMRRT